MGSEMCIRDSYKAVNERRLLHIYIDPAGVVRRYRTGDDLDIDRLRW